MGKPALWFPNRSDTNRLYSHRKWLEAGNFGFRKLRNCTICVAKTKALISFAVTAKLICVFDFAYANCWFSHEVAHLLIRSYSGFLNMTKDVPGKSCTNKNELTI